MIGNILHKGDNKDDDDDDDDDNNNNSNNNNCNQIVNTEQLPNCIYPRNIVSDI